VHISIGTLLRATDHPSRTQRIVPDADRFYSATACAEFGAQLID
jgi:hypothetical protein